jgi:hypothetical protein
MENYFKGFMVEHIERGKNSKDDEFVKVAAHNTPLHADVFFQVVLDASIKTVETEPKVINQIEGEDWRATIMAYMCHYYELDNATEHIRMKQRAKAYQIVDNDLYKTSASSPHLRYVSKTEGQKLLSEFHTRICGFHIGSRALATKVLWQGFYWPAVIDDAAKLDATC